MVNIILFSASHITAFGTNSEEIKNFSVVNPIETVKKMNPGWNLGNTLDALPTEGSWNNPPVEEYTFDDIKNSGFKSVRLPVTWAEHIGPAPDYTVDPKWMDRVEQVVDWALERDFYVILNSHHDSDWVSKMAIDPQTGRYVNNYDNSMVRFEKLWEQIAERFKWKNEKLLFEFLNEPNDGQWEAKPEKPTDPNNPATRHELTGKQMNDMNRRLLKIIRSSGGYNDKRLVVISGLGNDINKTLRFFETPDDKNIIATIHWYTWPFFLRGAPTWGTFKERQDLEKEFEKVNDKFVKNGIPVIIGEFGADQTNEAYYLWFYIDSIAQTAYKDGLTTMLWDNGFLFDRIKRLWRDPVLPDIIVNASKGIPNSFVIQPTIYVESNKTLTDYTVNLELNGNLLKDISNGQYRLIKDVDYVLTNNNSRVTIKKEYLEALIKLGQIGINANLTFKFSQGADQIVKVIQYDQPVLSQTSIILDTSKRHSDLTIPIDFKGLQPSYVSAVEKKTKKSINSWLALDDGSVWYDENMSTVTFSGWILDKIKEDTLITFHFWPRNVKAEIEVKVVKPTPENK